jgi:hypothetical protein
MAALFRLAFVIFVAFCKNPFPFQIRVNSRDSWEKMRFTKLDLAIG